MDSVDERAAEPYGALSVLFPSLIGLEVLLRSGDLFLGGREDSVGDGHLVGVNGHLAVVAEHRRLLGGTRESLTIPVVG